MQLTKEQIEKLNEPLEMAMLEFETIRSVKIDPSQVFVEYYREYYPLIELWFLGDDYER